MKDPLHDNIDQELLVRFLSGEADADEMAKVRQWMMANSRNQQYVEDMKLLWNSGKNVKELASFDKQGDWIKVKARITKNAPPKEISRPKSLIKTRYVLAKVAVISALLVSTYFAWRILEKQDTVAETITVTSNDNLSSVTLPDGSNVYLNKNSSITYNKDFEGVIRAVSLTGEAFFEVTRNDSKPFLIKSGQAITEVVGTSFNVNYSVQDIVIVTVATGKVFLYDEEDKAHKITMTAGKEGKFIKGVGLSETISRDVNFLSWKTGELIFDNTFLARVAKDLERHYGIPVKLDSGELNSCTLTSTFRQQSLDEVLSEMKLVLPIQVQRKDKMVIITGERCHQR